MCSLGADVARRSNSGCRKSRLPRDTSRRRLAWRFSIWTAASSAHPPAQKCPSNVGIAAHEFEAVLGPELRRSREQPRRAKRIAASSGSLTRLLTQNPSSIRTKCMAGSLGVMSEHSNSSRRRDRHAANVIKREVVRQRCSQHLLVHRDQLPEIAAQLFFDHVHLRCKSDLLVVGCQRNLRRYPVIELPICTDARKQCVMSDLCRIPPRARSAGRTSTSGIPLS